MSSKWGKHEMKTMTDFIFLGSKITANGYHSHEIKRHLLLGRKVMTNLCMHAKLLQLCATFCDPMNVSLPSSSVHGNLQARFREWIAMPSSSWPRNWTSISHVPCIAGGFFTHWATWEAHCKPRQCFKKQRHHFDYKDPYSQSYVFLSGRVWMRVWAKKKTECRRNDAFKLWNWRRLLRVPWTTRRSNQSIIKEISPEYSLERLMLKLKLQYFGHLMQRADTLKKTLMLGKIEGRRRRGQQRTRQFNGITYSMDMSWRKFWVIVKDMEACYAAIHVVAKIQMWLSNWKTTAIFIPCVMI